MQHERHDYLSTERLSQLRSRYGDAIPTPCTSATLAAVITVPPSAAPSCVNTQNSEAVLELTAVDDGSRRGGPAPSQPTVVGDDSCPACPMSTTPSATCPRHDQGATSSGSADSQLQQLWSRLLSEELPLDAPVMWPTIGALRAELLGGGYEALLRDRDDLKTSCKRLCAIGMSCLAEIEWEAEWARGSGLTGLFSGDTTGIGLLRCSTGLRPPLSSSTTPAGLRVGGWLFAGELRQAQLFPCAAFKVPRGHASSANILFGGRKVGQASAKFFESPLATVLTEKIGRPLHGLLKSFRQFSAFPTQVTKLGSRMHAVGVTPFGNSAVVCVQSEGRALFTASLGSALDSRLLICQPAWHSPLGPHGIYTLHDTDLPYVWAAQGAVSNPDLAAHPDVAHTFGSLSHPDLAA